MKAFSTAAAPGRTAFRLIMAVLLIVGRLMTPAFAMPDHSKSPIGEVPICHAADLDGHPAHGSEHPESHHDCPACSICCLSHVAAPVSNPPLVRGSSRVSVIAVAAPPPPATGPPGRVSIATPPTGPPSLSI